MSNESTKDNFSRTVSVISVIIASIAALFTYLQYRSNYTESVRIEYLNSNLPIKLDHNPLKSFSGDILGYFVSIPESFVVSNTSNIKISLTISYINADDGQFIPKEVQDYKGDPVNRATPLDGGDSLNLTVYVSRLIEEKIFNILAQKGNSLLSKYEARKLLAVNGYDFYGNKVDLETTGFRGAHPIDEGVSPKFTFGVVTGRGNNFEISFIDNQFP